MGYDLKKGKLLLYSCRMIGLGGIVSYSQSKDYKSIKIDAILIIYIPLQSLDDIMKKIF